MIFCKFCPYLTFLTKVLSMSYNVTQIVRYKVPRSLTLINRIKEDHASPSLSLRSAMSPSIRVLHNSTPPLRSFLDKPRPPAQREGGGEQRKRRAKSVGSYTECGKHVSALELSGTRVFIVFFCGKFETVVQV